MYSRSIQIRFRPSYLSLFKKVSIATKKQACTNKSKDTVIHTGHAFKENPDIPTDRFLVTRHSGNERSAVRLFVLRYPVFRLIKMIGWIQGLTTNMKIYIQQRIRMHGIARQRPHLHDIVLIPYIADLSYLFSVLKSVILTRNKLTRIYFAYLCA